ncbi:glycosyltransferase family 4 protein [Streptomyces sp. NPDC088733]|uniref:glycosyltransferase family 4 protein n=1 Tax=Streptomyces sp. NPDC088733 TaxID=3365880 RepID=UPI00381489C4
MRISFLIHNGYGIGGTIRTTFNLSAALAAGGHDVEIVSVFRHREEPALRLDPGVRLRHLVDLRRTSGTYDGDHPLAQWPAVVFPAADARHGLYSALTDERIAAHLAALEADVVIGTRPGLNVHVARQAPRRAVRVAQEHLTLETHSVRLRLVLRRLYPRLDAVITTTESDADAYRRRLRLPGVVVRSVPNSVPDPGITPGALQAKFVVAAGRLAAVKRYEDLIRAFDKVRAERPDWGLRLYGTGDRRASLARLVEKLELGGTVRLMGPVSPMEPEMAKASILAVSSTLESFGMTIVEAMRVGLPVVSTDCPLGPGEIVEHGVDGLLVPPRDIDAMASALLRLINDEEMRKRMGRAALLKGARYDPGRVAEVYIGLFQELLDRRTGAAGRVRGAGRHAGALALGAAYAAKDAAKRAVRRVRPPAKRAT